MEALDDCSCAAADGSISSVLNSALCHIYDGKLCQDRIEESRRESSRKGASPMAKLQPVDANASFSVSTASRKGTETDGPLSDADLEVVLQDIELAQVVPTSARASAFISDLINFPGVRQAIADCGGWSCIEQSARLISEIDLESVVVDEAHFVLLQDVEKLLAEIEASQPESEMASKAAQRCLNEIWRKFKCGKVNAAALRRNPNIGVVKQALVEGNTKYAFPKLVVPEDSDEEEDD